MFDLFSEFSSLVLIAKVDGLKEEKALRIESGVARAKKTDQKHP